MSWEAGKDCERSIVIGRVWFINCHHRSSHCTGGNQERWRRRSLTPISRQSTEAASPAVMMGTRHRSWLALMPAALMLLAAVSLVFHGMVPAMASAAAVATMADTHVRSHHGCPDALAAVGSDHHASHYQDHGLATVVPDDTASPAVETPEYPVPKNRPLDCCTAVMAVVLPAAPVSSVPSVGVAQSIIPRDGDIPEGVRLEDPVRPPRTTSQG